MADPELHVSTTGNDTKGDGSAGNPFRTIQKAAAELGRRLLSGQTGKILAQPGLYEEVVVLTSGMRLLRADSKDQIVLDVENETQSELTPAVRLKRPAAASAPGQDSTRPTWSEVLKIHGNDVLVQGVRIEGDGRPQRAVFVHDSENVTFQGCVITGGRTTIFYTGKEAGTQADPFSSAVLEEGEGAGVRVLRAKKVAFVNCGFYDNRTELKYEQAVKENEIAVLMQNSKWIMGVRLGVIDQEKTLRRLRQSQSVRDGGGHLSCFDADDIQVTNCFFIRGYCGGRGGAVQLAHNAYGSFDRCLFQGNESGVDGGAFAFSDPDPKFYSRKPISLTRCKFKNNTGGDDAGGAYFTTKAQATLTDCLFEENEAKSNGGGVRITFGASVKLINCKFERNIANTDNASRLEKNVDGGGAIAVQDGLLEMIGGSIQNNICKGFAGGGIYFITAAYDKNAEELAKITHGHTFEKILKEGYGVTAVWLKLQNVIIAHNKAVEETCWAETCTLSPRKGFEARGAGGAVYALESKDFGVPLAVTLDNVSVIENQSLHVEEQNKADLVFRNVTKLTLTGSKVIKAPANKYALSLISDKDVDLSGSPQVLRIRKAGEVYEESSSVKP